MKKYILSFVILLVAISITSCSSNDDDSTTQEMKSLILGKWAKILTITLEGNEYDGSEGCPDTWNFLENTVEIKDYLLNNEPPCGDLGLDIVREYKVVDNSLKIVKPDGTISETYKITELTSTNLSLSINSLTLKWVKL